MSLPAGVWLLSSCVPGSLVCFLLYDSEIFELLGSLAGI